MLFKNKHKILKHFLPILIYFLVFIISVPYVTAKIQPMIIPDRVGVNLQDDIVYVDGVVKNGVIGHAITLLILYPGTDINDIKNNDIANMNQTVILQNPESGKDPIFRFESYRMQQLAPTGEYTVFIQGHGLDEVTYKFSYKGVDTLYEGLDKISKESDLNNAIAIGKQYLDIDGTAYENLTTEAKELINPQIVAKIKTLSLSQYSDYNSNPNRVRELKDIATQFRRFYKDMIAIGEFSDRNNALEIKQWIETNKDIAALENNNKDIYKIYEDMNETQQDSVYQSLSTMNVLDSLNKIREAFYNQTLLKGIELLPWTETKRIISDFSDKFNREDKVLNWTEFNKLNSYNKDGIYESIAGNAYVTLDAVREVFNEVVSKRLTTQNQSTIGGSPGATKGTTISKISISPIAGIDSESDKKEKEEKELVFKDISAVPWAEEAIHALTKKGIIHGRAEGRFDPEAKVTRAEFIKILMGSFNQKPNVIGEGFTDVNNDEWYHPYILNAQGHGIVTGINGGTFEPNTFISRQDMVVLLYRTIHISSVMLPKPKQDATFKDGSEISEYAQKAVGELANIGVISGMNDGNFVPLGTATRAQAARVVYELIKLIE